MNQLSHKFSTLGDLSKHVNSCCAYRLFEIDGRFLFGKKDRMIRRNNTWVVLPRWTINVGYKMGVWEGVGVVWRVGVGMWVEWGRMRVGLGWG